MPSEAFTPGLNKSLGIQPELKQSRAFSIPTPGPGHIKIPGHAEQSSDAEQNATQHSGRKTVKTELNLKGLLSCNFHSGTSAREHSFGTGALEVSLSSSSLTTLPESPQWQLAAGQGGSRPFVPESWTDSSRALT